MIGRTPRTALLALLLAIGCSSNGKSENDAAAGDAGDASNAVDTGGLPGFGQGCAPIAQQGDPQCAAGLVCVSVGAEQGRNLCTKTCTTVDAPCTGGPSGSTPICGREYQLAPNSRVCEFFCNASAPNCPPATTCLVDFSGMMTCQPGFQPPSP
jgi:hypothetical protein